MKPTAPGIRAALLGADDTDIVAAEDQLRDAQLRGDAAALDALIAEELLFAGPDGRLATKAEDLQAHASRLVRFIAHEPVELRIRRIGPDVAAASLLAALEVEVAGARHAGTFRYLRVWAREGGRWKVVAGQVSRVAD